MSAIAVVVGVDAYADQPLTSAVHDALAFRDELVSLGLVQPTDVRLLTAPVVGGSTLADSRNIDRTLHDVYDTGSGADRLFVFFAGHGLLAPTDVARSVFQTAFVPVDLADLRNDSRLLFNVDDLVERFKLAGPPEQYFFVDACRDLAFGENPGNLASLTWPASRNPAGSATAQAILYAVSPLGEARSVRDGMGVMTSHLIEAFRGRGSALDMSDLDDAYVVTANSVARYVSARVKTSVSGEAQWQQLFMLPELRLSGPDLTAIRTVDDPPDRWLTLTFDPTDAAPSTSVRLMSRGNTVEEPAWPPRGHGETVPIPPQVFGFRVRSQLGDARAEPARIDAREQDAVIIRIGAPPASPVGDAGPSPAGVQDAPVERGGLTGAARTTATIRADAQERETVIEVVALDPPYESFHAEHSIERQVAPGAYRIRFRLGSEVFCETDVDVARGEVKVVRPAVAASPLLAETLNTSNKETVEILESIGPIQAEVLPTTLALIGVKPFDKTGSIKGSIEGLVHPLEFADFGERPLRILVAIDGRRWPRRISAVARSIRCKLVSADGTESPVPLTQVKRGDTGWGRVVHGAITAPGPSFAVKVGSPLIGTFNLAATSLPGRITVVALVLRPDGKFDLAQHVLRLPGREYAEPVTSVPYGQMVRQLILGQRLFQSGELVEQVDQPTTPLWELLHAKWTDPLLGSMALYGWLDAIGRRPGPEARSLADETARNLLRYFGELPDARVAAARMLAGQRAELIEGLLADDAVPVLARSMRELANEASARGAGSARVVEWARRVPLTAGWTCRFEPATSAALREVTHGSAVSVSG
jgi:uncharacterized caspase-like protein